MKISSKLTQILNKSLSSLKYPNKDFSLSAPKNSEFGDLSTSLALTLSKELKQSPIDIANNVVSNLTIPKNLIDEVTVTKPGFINFKISNNYYHRILKEIVNEKNMALGLLEKVKKQMSNL